MYKMIIVDDEPLELSLISSLKIWNQYGIEIIATYEYAPDALSFIKENKVDIILSDICMSGMNGIDFFKEAKLISPEVIFIFVTAYNNFEYMHTAIVYNAFDYIVKPVTNEALTHLVLRIVDKLTNTEDNVEPNFAALSCQQALIDYCCSKITLDDLCACIANNGINFNPDNDASCLFEITIDNFDELLCTWNYNIDRLYTAFQNLSKNDAFDIIPLKYNYDTITLLTIIHSREKFKSALDGYISNCASIFGRTFSIKRLSEISGFEKLREPICRILDILKSSEKSSGDNHFAIELAKKYIEENYSKDISLNTLAEYISMSPYHTSRLFKKYTGETFINYLNLFRINRAKYLLLNTNKKINEIRTEIGCLNKDYFSRLFRKYTGLTPSEYRYKYSE